jgi:hypothetical protein
VKYGTDAALSSYRNHLLDEVLGRFGQLDDRRAYNMVSIQKFFNRKGIKAEDLYEEMESAAIK